MSRIQGAFEQCAKQGRAALVVYLTAGDPSLDESVSLLVAAEKAGADVIELGVPFSDPTADGPSIQQAMLRSLVHGTGLEDCLNVVERARAQGVSVPVVLFGYFNPILQVGVDNFCDRAAAAGVDGVLTVDLPFEELDELAVPASKRGIDTVPLVAPTSGGRVSRLAGRQWGFVYCVARTGVTGSGSGDAVAGPELVASIKEHTDAPVAVGFGIRTREDVAHTAQFADGVVVGSALIDAIAMSQDKIKAAESFIQQLALGLPQMG